MSLDLAIKTLDELINEVDTTIRDEFRDYSDRLDDVIMLLRQVDRSDVGLLVSQMGRMQAIMAYGTECTCEAEARWHACLGRLSTAVGQAAERYNMESIRPFCEAMGVDFADVMNFLKSVAPDELPDLPENVTIPDNASELTP